jgi:hypothetical protein
MAAADHPYPVYNSVSDFPLEESEQVPRIFSRIEDLPFEQSAYV